MTVTIKKSEIQAAIANAPANYHVRLLQSFPESVAAHVAELDYHAAHMELVAKGKADAYPPPDPPVLINQAVSRIERGGKIVHVADFVVVDDLPTEQQIRDKRLADKKSELISAVSSEESHLSNKAFPIGKRRAAEFARLDILRADDARQRDIGDIVKHRPPSDTALLNDYNKRSASIESLARHAAMLHSQIEGLTLDTVDTWRPEPFPKV